MRGGSSAGEGVECTHDSASSNRSTHGEEESSMKPAVLCCIAVALVLTMPASAQKFEGVAVKSGQATFTFAGKDLAFSAVEGGFQQVQGFTLATLIFKPAPKSNEDTHLNLTLMYQAPGKIDLNAAFSMSGIGMFADGDVSRFTKGKSTCTITLTKATATALEGTAECPLLHNIEREVMPPLSNVKFSATIK
jgi:hypothetical protein